MEFPRPDFTPRPVSLIPMINIVFLLLSFFLIAGEITATRPGGVTLPLSAQPRDPLGEGLVLTLTADGQVLVDERAVKPEEAAAAMEARMPDKNAPVLVQCDRQADGAALVSVLAELERRGIGNVSLLTEGF